MENPKHEIIMSYVREIISNAVGTTIFTFLIVIITFQNAWGMWKLLYIVFLIFHIYFLFKNYRKLKIFLKMWNI